jgi:putative ABC transport system permease protein
MIRNYLNIALRNIQKNKTFSFINIFGLAVSMSVCLLVITMVAGLHEYDRFHENYDHIHRVISKRIKSSNWNATSPFPVGSYLKDEYDGIEDVTTLRNGFGGDAAIGDNAIPVTGFYASESFFNVFSFPLIAGDRDQVLKEPFSVVLTQEAAKKLFGDTNPIGNVITFSDRGLMMFGISTKNVPVDLGEFTVTGIIDEFPANSHFAFEILASASTLPSLISQEKIEDLSNDWTNIWNTYHYVLLNDDRDEAYLNSLLTNIAENQYLDHEKKECVFKAQPLSTITPGKLLNNPVSLRLPIEAVYFLTILAVVLIFSACFNYTNLTVARSLTRAREVGIRKVSGAFKRQIFLQFLSESVVMAVLALIISYGLLQLLKPAFLGLWINKYINISYSSDPLILLIFLAFSVLVGIIAGVIPSFYLSRFKPIKVLKALGSAKMFGNLSLRKSLIVLQFTISLLFILSTTFVYFQLRYLVKAEYGFNKDNILNIQLQGNKYEQFKTEIGAHKGISGVSGSSYLPSTAYSTSFMVWNSEDLNDSLRMEWMQVDGNFIPNFDLKIIAGRNFSTEMSMENINSLIINETAVEKWGFENPHDAIGKHLMLNKEDDAEIIGVVSDFHFKLKMDEIGPLLFRNNPEKFRYANVKVVPGAIEEVDKFLEKKWKGFDKYHSYESRLYDHTLAETHAIFSDISYIVGFIAFLAITIACLGLLGMVTFAAETKTKEIGIRKTMGAEVNNIIVNLSKGYFLLLGIAIILAIPMTWFINDLWLREFAYKIDIGIPHYLIGIGIMVILGILTIGSQTFKAARANPVDALRYE